jgi:hypothetical protein
MGEYRQVGADLSLSGLSRAASEGNAFLNKRQHNVELCHRSRAVDHEFRAEILILMWLSPAQISSVSR